MEELGGLTYMTRTRVFDDKLKHELVEKAEAKVIKNEAAK